MLQYYTSEVDLSSFPKISIDSLSTYPTAPCGHNAELRWLIRKEAGLFYNVRGEYFLP
jgi:hypothetical protein